MNEDIEECVETKSGNKIRKQSNDHIENSEESEKIDVDDFESSYFQCRNNRENSNDNSCDSISSNMSGVEMSSLHNRNYLNGYCATNKENLSLNCERQDAENHADKKCKNLMYKKIYSSSSSEDDDEHCVYTYKGAEVAADLPESFIYLGVDIHNGRDGNSICSSPDMDYLEMDFDPGPLNDQDSDTDNVSPFQNVSSNEQRTENNYDANERSQIDAYELHFENDTVAACDENANCYTDRSTFAGNEPLNFVKESSFPPVELCETALDFEKPCCSRSLNANENSFNTVECDSANNIFNNSNSVGSSSDTGTSEEEEYQLNLKRIMDEDIKEYVDKLDNGVEHSEFFNDLYENSDIAEETFILDGFYDDIDINENENSENDLFDFTFWDSDEIENNLICYNDLLPVDPSYSISAVVNVLKTLHIPHCSSTVRDLLVNFLRCKRIPENEPLVEYLLMRAIENANESDLIHFFTCCGFKLHSRFFSTYPKRNINLLEWLGTWMKKGAVPVVTRNVQKRGLSTSKNILRNPWKHNVVFQVEASYIHLSNPVEKIAQSILYSQLIQPPLIYVERKYVIKKWNSKVDLRNLLRANHDRWYNENVLGQVATVIREHDNCSKLTHFVRVPSSCQCGITLFVPQENLSLCKEIDEAIELPTATCC